jgi:hypothetical protein
MTLDTKSGATVTAPGELKAFVLVNGTQVPGTLHDFIFATE